MTAGTRRLVWLAGLLALIGSCPFAEGAVHCPEREVDTSVYLCACSEQQDPTEACLRRGDSSRSLHSRRAVEAAVDV